MGFVGFIVLARGEITSTKHGVSCGEDGGWPGWFPVGYPYCRKLMLEISNGRRTCNLRVIVSLATFCCKWTCNLWLVALQVATIPVHLNSIHLMQLGEVFEVLLECI